MFRKLCGYSALRNVVIVTNMWGEVDLRVGEAREAELIREGIFFKPVLDKGAQMARHKNTVPSAEKIIRLILDNHPLPLRIQKELVTEHKNISQTSAGEEVNRELNVQIKKHQQEMRALRQEMKQAMRDMDKETRRELEIETQKMQGEIAKFKNDVKRLESDYKREKERLEARLAETRQEAECVAAQHQRQIDELSNAFQVNAAASEREKAQTREQVNEQINEQFRELFRRGERAYGGGGGLFSIIGATLDRMVPVQDSSLR
jgi:hypothetical protein